MNTPNEGQARKLQRFPDTCRELRAAIFIEMEPVFDALLDGLLWAMDKLLCAIERVRTGR